MKIRLVPAFLVAACLPVLSATASQPDRYAGKMIPNPPVSEQDVIGLPPVNCGGFQWFEPVQATPPGPDDTYVVDLAIVPSRNAGADLAISAVGANIVMLNFRNGLVGGLPYLRSAWNDVRLELRPTTQDYTLTVNGTMAGPFPYGSFCALQGGCFAVAGFYFSLGTFDESDIAWLDSLRISRVGPAGSEDLLTQSFDTCNRPHVYMGGLLEVTPPPRLQKR